MNVIRTALAALTLTLGSAAAVTAAPLDARISNTGGISIAVKPVSLDPGAKSWDFEVSMNTHTKRLDQDLARVSALVDDGGKQYQPSAWKGDPPGGHHRKNVLQFAPVPGNPKSLELRITGLGTPEARVFAWKRP